MALYYDRGTFSALKHAWFVSLFVVAFLVSGCGGSEEATQEQTGDEGQKLGEQEKPKEEKPMDQALTSFIGEDKEKKEEPKPVQQAPAPTQATPLSQYEKQIDDLRTENTSLKQKIVKLEQDNRTLTARITETESKLAAEKDRADKAEEAAKGAIATATTKGAEVKAPPTSDARMSVYEEALKSFNAKKYEEALASFQSMLDGGVSDDLADNCKYWIGESNFAKKKYKDAMASFEEVFKYKNSEKKADAQFMIAQCYERSGNKAKAKESYEKVVKDYPMSKNVKKSKERWAKL